MKYQSYVSIVKQKTGLADDQFQTEFGKIRSLVDRLFSSSQHHRVFKGKWYATILEQDIRDLASAQNRTLLLNDFGGRVKASLLQSLDFKQPWADRFLSPVKRVLKRLEQ